MKSFPPNSSGLLGQRVKICKKGTSQGFADEDKTAKGV